MQDEALRIVQPAQGRHRSIRHPRRWRHLRQNAPIRPAELQLAVRLSLDAVALLVHGAVMAAVSQETREFLAALGGLG